MSSPKQATDAIHVTDELQSDTLPPAIVRGAADTGHMKEGLSKDMKIPEELKETTQLSASAHLKMEKINEPPAHKDTAEHEATEDHGPAEISSELAEPFPGLDTMESSTATLQPELGLHPMPISSTPKTPKSSNPPSRSTSSAKSITQFAGTSEPPERSPTRSDIGFDEKNSASEDEREGNSRTEIQSIMDQFSEEGQGPDHEEVTSPRLEFAGPLLGAPIQHPPRKSSLEPLKSDISAVYSMQDLRMSSNSTQALNELEQGPAVPPKPGSIHSFRTGNRDDRFSSIDSPLSPPPLHRPPPPEPEPEPDLPFDFHRFLEQLRHRTADPVAKFLRSFLQEFGKKQWMVHEQVKIVGDFLAFITNKMGQCEVWREVSDAEFDNAREGMEKLVMNRLYTQTFSPAISPPQIIPGGKPRRKGAERLMGPGRRGQHQEDVERDDILAQKVSIYGWITEEHLEISPVGDSGKRFLILAQQGKSRKLCLVLVSGLIVLQNFLKSRPTERLETRSFVS